MLGKNNSTQNFVTSQGSDLLHGSGMPHKLRFKAIIIALLAVGVIGGLFFYRMIAGNMILAVAVASFILLIFVGADYRRGWMMLILVSTISAIKMNVGVISIRPDQVVFLWVLFVFLGSFVIGKVRLQHTPLIIPIIGTVAVNFLSTFLYAPDKSFSYQSCTLLAIYIFMYILTVNVLEQDIRFLKSTPLLLVIIGIGQALYGLLAVVSHSAGIDIKGVTVTAAGVGVAVAGGFEEANPMGAFLALIALFLLAHISVKSEWQQRGALIYFGFTIVMMALLLTYTRSAWISFALGSIIMIIALRPERNIFNTRSLALLVGLVIIFVAVGVPLGNYITASTGGAKGGLTDRLSNIVNYAEGSGEGRAEIQAVAISRWKENPLLGKGTFSMPQTGSGRTALGGFLYSSVIQSLHDSGLVGAIFIIWIYIGGIVIGIKGFKKSTTRFWKATLAGGTIGWIAIIITSQASSFVWLSFSWIYLGMLVSWSCRISDLESSGAEDLRMNPGTG